MINLFSGKEEYKTLTLRPYSYLATSFGQTVTAMFIMLLPQILMLFITGSFDSLKVLTASVCGTVCAECLMRYAIKRIFNFSGLIAAVQGIIIGLLLPSAYPPLAVFFIVFCTVILVQYAFGEFSGSWINPAVIAVAVAWFIGMSEFPSFLVTAEDLSVRNPAFMLIQNGTFPMIKTDAKITAFLNNMLFSHFRVSIPDGYVSLLWDTHSVIPAFRFNLITLITSLIMISFDMLDYIIPVCYLTVYALLVRFFEPVFFQGQFGQGDILLALLTSGTLFCCVYVIQWYGTTPVSVKGKVLYGCMGGIIAFFIVGCGTSPVGTVMTILIMNIISPVIQLIEENNNIRKLYRTVLPRLDKNGKDE